MSIGKEVLFAHNFDKNLEEFRKFCLESDRELAFESLLDELFEKVVPNLEQFPDIGRNFLDKEAHSTQSLILKSKIREKIGKDQEIRLLVSGDHLILYVVSHLSVVLLSIKHHKQLSFDVDSFLDD